MKVKICGITCLEDGLAAVDAGADLLGFNFYPRSKRYIDPPSASRLVRTLHFYHPQVRMVGVFVNSSIEEILAVMDQCGIDLAQLSGDEPPEVLSELKGRAIKALRPKDARDLSQSLEGYPPHAGEPAYLVDAYRSGEYGGTGQLADWSLARSLARSYPILLAGGLTPENVGEAVRQARPWGVDVASGVESSPRRKDPARLAEFIRAAKEAALDYQEIK